MLDLLKRLVSLAAARNFLLTLELIAIPLSIYAIIQSSIAIRLQAEGNNEQRISSAWSQLTTPASGNSGKGEAINRLFKEGEELSGMLLNCEAMGGTYVEDPKRRCKGAPYISGLNLIGGTPPQETLHAIAQLENPAMDPEECTLDALNMNGSDLSGSVLKKSTIYCGMLVDITAKDAYFDNVVIANSWLYNFDISGSVGLTLLRNRIDGMVAVKSVFIGTDFGGTHASGINFTDAKFDKVKLAGLEGQDFNVSGADFCYFNNEAFPSDEEHCPESIPDDVLAGMWAWSDMPPKGIGATAERLKSVKLCASEYRETNFGTEFGDYGFVYDRGYMAPERCFAGSGNQL